MLRTWRVHTAAIGLTSILFVVLVQTTGGGAAPLASTSAEAGTGCKLAGKRFVGTTSQKKKLCFTLTASGTGLREFAYDYRAKCKQQGGVVQLSSSSGTTRSIFQKPLALGADGSFSRTGTGGFLKGRIGSTTASGTFRSTSSQQVPSSVTPPITFVTASCDTGIVRWNARRASG